jgi:hypothetical protein
VLRRLATVIAWLMLLALIFGVLAALFFWALSNAANR